MNKKIIILLLLVVLVLFVGSINKITKEDIRLATQDDLVKLNDIGEVLAKRIVIYAECNENCTVDDLICIDGIGEQRLKEIKKHYY